MSDTENQSAAEPVAAPPVDAIVTTIAQTPPVIERALPTGPERPAEGNLHDIIAWLEARVAWLEGLIHKA